MTIRHFYFSLVLQLSLALFTTNSVLAETVGFHDRFDEVLNAHVADGQVNYPGINMDPNFQIYVDELETVRKFVNDDEELAYLINAYNALAIKGILDGRSPSSLFGRYRYFISAKHRLNGSQLNLYDLEKKIIVPKNELRIHFAIVCASTSCPPLQPYAYRAEQLEEQLEAVTYDFINDSAKNRFDQEAKIAYISKIFDWFEDDFAAEYGSVSQYIAGYIDDSEIAAALKRGEYKIKYLKYDWSLNGLSPN